VHNICKVHALAGAGHLAFSAFHIHLVSVPA